MPARGWTQPVTAKLDGQATNLKIALMRRLLNRDVRGRLERLHRTLGSDPSST
jgi:hypothetical protein